MQSELLDILIIGSLVLLFAATYRKRTTQLVRSWTFGWLLILLHFTAQLFHPTLAFAQDIQGILSIGGLVACAIVFLYPTGEAAREKRLQRPLLIGAGVSAMAFVALVVCDVSNPVPYYFAVILGEICWIAYSLQHRRDSYLIQGLATVAIAGLTAWLVWAVVHGRYDIGIAALLTQLYWTVALTYTAQFRRLSAGTLTVSFGLLAWSAVFPAGEFCAHLRIVSGISPELWNIPKYFVAFGMILILLEDEIIAANEASKHYRLLFEANPHPMWIYDRDTLAFHSVNDAAVAQYGFPRAKFLGMTLMDIQASLAPGSMDERAQTAEALREADPTRQLTGPWQHKKNDGSMFLADIATSQMQTAGRELAFSLIQDVTERELLHERLLHQANHDMLTCLPNRARFEEYARLSLPRSDHQGHHSALLCIDIDRFKHINDTYGHAAGDVCLQEVGRRLAPLVHGRDLVARTGGEEFCLLLHDLSSSTDSEHVAARVLVALQAPINADGYSIELTGSIGIAVTPADGKDASTLWRNADCAMYRAKRAGGNQYSCMSPELRVLTSQATDIEQHVRRTLNEGQLEIHYQPLYKMDGELRGLEALVRLRHPEHGLISPDRFIPIVEESGLIVRLGSAVIEQVCAQLAQWKREGLPPVRVAVNISPLQITRPDFATQVIDLLTKHNIEPVYLGMEITETAVMRNLSEASRQIELLAAKGIAFSIDDFGTGYSSLGQLDKLPVRSLKIDRSFIERIHLPGGTWSIVDAIISMAHSLGLEVVAEGVESEAQLQHLRDLDCDTVQGFLFSRPLPAADIMSVLSGTLRKRPVKVRQIDQARTA